ncbi:MAG TPA: LysR family transcriptional regulator [Burkholderiales bacterium]|nr:LysR family transcriptional regulator [Burkholderiales bacterium]
MSRDLNDTLVFVKVVEHGSFISAARALRLPKTTVSRRIQDLETRLGAQLLHRTTRKLGLTEAGNVYFEHSQRIARELDNAEHAVNELQGGPRGWLRITTPYSMGVTWIAPLLNEYRAAHPEVRVDMVLSNESLDLIHREIDVALRVGNLPDSNLVARRLAVFRTQVYASPAYLARHGEPLRPEDLQHHRALVTEKYRNTGNSFRTGNGFSWTLSDGQRAAEYPIEPVMVANDPAALQPALLAGDGLMLAADLMIKPHAAHGLVQRVLAGWTGPSPEFNALFPRGHGKSPKVRSFVDFLVQRLNFDADYMEELCPNRKCHGGLVALPAEVPGADGADGAAGDAVPLHDGVQAA